MVLQLLPALRVDLAAVQLYSEDRFDPRLFRRLLKLDMRHDVPVLGEGQGGTVEFADTANVSVGQLEAVEEAVGRVMMEGSKSERSGESRVAASTSLFPNQGRLIFMVADLSV